MKTKLIKKIYSIVNIIVSFCVIIYFILRGDDLFNLNIDLRYLLILIIPFGFIHFFRILRQYIILMEEKISIKELTKLYFISSLINAIFPYRIGELYKIFLYGYEIKDLKKSLVAVLIDKFLDSILLLTLFIIIELIYKQTLSIITVMLLFFVCFILILYVTFESTYYYLNRYLIINKKSRITIKFLKIIEDTNNLFISAKNMIKNRETLLVLLTIFSWFFEAIFILLISKKININFNLMYFIKYINNSFIGLQNEFSNYYIYITTIVFSVYIIILAIINIKKSGGKINEKNSISL